MANTTTVTVLYDGVKNCIVQLNGVNDGGTGETFVKKVDVKELNPPCQKLAIRRVHYDVTGGIAQLYWEADDPTLIDNLVSIAEEDFSWSGGTQNNGGSSATGNILLSTLGFDVGSSYSIKLEMTKKYADKAIAA